MKLPAKQASLFSLATDAADGAKKQQAAIGLTHHTETTIRAFLAAATTGATNYNNAVATQADLSKAMAVADSNGKAFIGAARKVLAPYLGENYSAAWQPTGFPDQSLAVPTQQGVRLVLLKALQTYFTQNPSRENADLKVNITAVQAGILHDALDTARTNFSTAQSQTLKLKTDRDTAVDALRDELTGLLSELGDLVSDSDPKWLAFGFPLPSADHVPDQPDQLVLAAAGPGSIHADWADTPRAEHYHMEGQVVGVDADFVRLQTRDESDATLTGLASGKTIRLRIVAVNTAGESIPSDAGEIVVP